MENNVWTNIVFEIIISHSNIYIKLISLLHNNQIYGNVHCWKYGYVVHVYRV